MILGSPVPPPLRRAAGSLLAISILGLGACADSGGSMVGPALDAPAPAGA